MLEFVGANKTVETIALARADGRILAQDIGAVRDQPPFSASAMDGYALRSADAPGRLRVIGEASAGAGLGRALAPGECARIFTGAPLPAGADCVAIQEYVTRDGDSAAIPETPAGQHVRAQGLDFRSGDTLLRAGTRLDGVAIALAAAAGRAELGVRARPRIALLATGDELMAPGGIPGPHQIFDSVSFGLAALVRQWGGEALLLNTRGDDIAELAAEAKRGLDGDLLVTIGGASVGDRDLVKPALATLGVAIVAERSNIRPGKPVWFGAAETARVLGLPGNPASALVCAQLFLKPLMAKMLGLEPNVRFARAHLAGALPANGPREHYLRSRLSSDESGRLVVSPFEQQDSSLLSVLRDADALIRIDANAPALAAGALVDVLALDR
jgi:molybdopterin molybdotransferase